MDADIVVALAGTCEIGRGRRAPLTGRPAAVLTVLAAASPSWVGADAVIDHVWGDDAIDVSRGALHQVVRRVRRRLGDDADLLESSDAGYRLLWDPARIDLAAADTAVDEVIGLVGRGRIDEASAIARQTLDLVPGEPFAEFVDLAPARTRARQLTERRLSMVETVVEAELGRGGGAEWTTQLATLADDEVYREPIWCLLARCQAVAGRHVDAVRSIATLRDHLAGIGMVPSSETQRVEASLFGGSTEATGTDRSQQTADQGPLRGYSPAAYVGNARVRAAVMQTVTGQHPAIVVLRGEAGSGKSHTTALAATEAAVTGVHVAYTSFDAFSELGELDAAIVPPDVASGRALVVIEDLHWATGEQLGPVAAALLRRQIDRTSAILTGRPGVGGWEAWLARLAPTLGPNEIDMPPLRTDDVEPLARRLDVPAPADARRVIELTAGNPLLMVEVLRSGIDTTAATGLADTASRVLRARLAHVSPALRDLLDVVALLGGEADLDVIARTLDASPGVLSSLVDDAIHSGLLRESGRRSWVRLAHDLLRIALMEQLSEARRSVLGGAAAEALTESGTPTSLAGMRQLVLSGGGGTETTSEATLGLAEEALRQGRWQRAIELCDRVEQPLLDAVSDDRPSRRHHQLLARSGIIGGSAAEASNRIDETRQRCGMAFSNAAAAGDWDLALAAGRLSLLALSPGDPNESIRLALADPSLVDGLVGQPNSPRHARIALDALRAVHDGTATLADQPRNEPSVTERILKLHASVVSDGLDADPDLVELVTQCRLLIGQGLPDQADQLRLADWRVSYHRDGDADRLNAIFHRLPRLLALGHRDRLLADLDELVDGAARIGHRDYLVTASQTRAALAMADGRLDVAARHLDAADLMIGDHEVSRDLSIVQRWWMLQLDDPGQVVDLAQHTADSNRHRPAMQAIAAYNHMRVGDRAAARAALDRVADDDGIGVPRDLTFPIAAVGLLEVAADVGATDLIETLLAETEPYSGQLAFAVGFAFPYGAFDRAIAIGRAAMGDSAAAADRFERAITVERAFGADGLVATTAAARDRWGR